MNNQSQKSSDTEFFSNWVKRLKEEGKSDQEIGQLLSGATRFSAFDVYIAIMSSLKEEDMKEIETITDDNEAKSRMMKLFKLRTGMEVQEMITKVQKGFAQAYLESLKSSKG